MIRNDILFFEGRKKRQQLGEENNKLLFSYKTNTANCQRCIVSNVLDRTQKIFSAKQHAKKKGPQMLCSTILTFFVVFEHEMLCIPCCFAVLLLHIDCSSYSYYYGIGARMLLPDVAMRLCYSFHYIRRGFCSLPKSIASNPFEWFFFVHTVYRRIYLFNARFSCFRISRAHILLSRICFMGDFSKSCTFKPFSAFNWWLTTLKCACFRKITSHQSQRMAPKKI